MKDSYTTVPGADLLWGSYWTADHEARPPDLASVYAVKLFQDYF